MSTLNFDSLSLLLLQLFLVLPKKSGAAALLVHRQWRSSPKSGGCGGDMPARLLAHRARALDEREGKSGELFIWVWIWINYFGFGFGSDEFFFMNFYSHIFSEFLLSRKKADVHIQHPARCGPLCPARRPHPGDQSRHAKRH
jgi:hypothetical protein